MGTSQPLSLEALCCRTSKSSELSLSPEGPLRAYSVDTCGERELLMPMKIRSAYFMLMLQIPFTRPLLGTS